MRKISTVQWKGAFYKQLNSISRGGFSSTSSWHCDLDAKDGSDDTLFGHMMGNTLLVAVMIMARCLWISAASTDFWLMVHYSSIERTPRPIGYLLNGKVSQHYDQQLLRSCDSYGPKWVTASKGNRMVIPRLPSLVCFVYCLSELQYPKFNTDCLRNPAIVWRANILLIRRQMSWIFRPLKNIDEQLAFS